MEGDGRIRIAHVYLHALFRLLSASRSGEVDSCLTRLTRSLETEVDQLIARLLEVEGLAGSTVDGDACSFRLDGDAHLLGALLHGKDVDGEAYLFAGGEYPRQGGEQHQRGAHGDGLLGVSVASVLSGDEHHAHRADILRQAQGVGVLFSFIQLERADEFHHRFEAVGLGIGRLQHLVSADSEDRCIASGGGTQYLVEHIPRGDAQCLACIEFIPRIRCAEVREIQQTFVYQRQRVGHRMACLFADADGEVCLRAEHVGHIYPWMEYGGGVGY